MSRKKPTKKKSIKQVKQQLWDVTRSIIFKIYTDRAGATRCYTCGKPIFGKNRQLGHFITGATCPPSLYYNLNNLRPQCMRCNIHLSGNWVVFEQNLKEELGEEVVEEMKRARTLKAGEKWTFEDYVHLLELRTEFEKRIDKEILRKIDDWDRSLEKLEMLFFDRPESFCDILESGDHSLYNIQSHLLGKRAHHEKNDKHKDMA